MSVLNWGGAAALAISMLVGTGCGENRPEVTAPTGKAARVFAMSVLVSGVPFWNDTKATWVAIGSGNGIQTTYGGPLDTDGQRQIAEIEALIAKKVDGIVVYPTDSAALVPEINKAVDAGIPVITYLNDAPKSKRLTYITSELEDASLKIGRVVIGNNRKPAKAIIMYAEAGNEEQEARRRGFEMLVKEYPNLKIVDVVSDKFDENTGAQRLKPLLVKHPDLAYIFGCNSRSAVGAVSALKELRAQPGKVTVTAWDADEDVLNLIGQGWVKDSVYQNSAFMTQLAFDILEARVGGWMYPKNRKFEEAGVRSIPEKIVVPVQLIDQSNVRGYYPR